MANDAVREMARGYCWVYGYKAPIEGHYVEVNQDRAKRIAKEYERLDSISALARGAYCALAKEIEWQYQWARAWVNFEYTTQDPYPDSAAMFADVALGRLKVFTGGDAHPYLTLRENEHFRAVHDLFGHAAEGYQFGPRGEENAWIHHSMMFSPLAQAALTSETRGQNAWVNFGPHASLPVKERPFAEQKAALLPAWCWDWKKALED